MNLGKLFNDYKPHFKCGAEVAAATGASLFGSIVSSDTSSSNVSSQLHAQRVENQLNRDWQTAEAEKARQAQSDLSYGLQAQQEQFNLANMQEQARLNSPVYQSEQLRKARINPNVYFGQQSTFGGSSAPSVGEGSASPVSVGSVSGLSPVSFQPPNLNIADILRSIGSFRSDSAKAEEIKTLLMDRLAGLELDNEAKALANKWSQVELFVQRNIKDARIKKAFAEFDNIASDTYLKMASGDEKVSQTALNYSQMKLNDLLSEKTGSEIDYLKIQIGSLQRQIDAYIDHLKSGAALSTAQAQSENEFRSTRGAILGLEYALKNNELEVSDGTVKAAILSVCQKAVSEKWKTKQAYIDYLQKEYNLSTKGVKDAMNIITSWIPFAPGIRD